jgi:electron transport complex protein RnfA
MRELGFALLSSGLAWNVLTDRLVVPGAALGFTRKHKAVRHHLLAFFLALLPSLWISWTIATYVPFPGSLQWVLFLGIAGLVVWVEGMLSARWLHEGDVTAHLSLLPANCAFFGTILLVLSERQGFVLTTAKGAGATLGYGLVLYLLATFRNRLKGAPTPKALTGLPSALILLGLISMVLMGFAQAFHLYP